MSTSQYFDLDQLKRNIDLVEFAKSYGYEIDRKKSSANSIALKGSRDKIIVSRRSEKWGYFSVGNDRDRGTIIDFVQYRSNHHSVAEVIGYLREQVGLPLSPKTVPNHDGNNQERIANIFRKLPAVDSSLVP